MYGATEAAARLTYLPPADLSRKLGSIGRPIPGVEIDVITDDGGVAECGSIGELVARGPNVSPGYWNDPAATRERFAANGFRTGDLGYRDVDGYLYVVGRRHDMLKIGGHRVCPAEIEQVLQEHPAVVEAAVVGVDDDRLGERPAAFVVLRAPMAAEVTALRAFCASRLPGPKVPVVITLQQELPKLASGKLDRQALRACARTSLVEPAPTSQVSTGCPL
jgi:acyl-CoA synthetase (AMP-forming)/AMP-acid ligase II